MTPLLQGYVYWLKIAMQLVQVLCDMQHSIACGHLMPPLLLQLELES